MAFFGKVYSLYKQENFDGWLKSQGLSEDKIAALLNDTPTQRVVDNGDGTFTSTATIAGKSKDYTFTSGVEFNDTFGIENLPVKTTFTVDGNTVTQVITNASGVKTTMKKDFNGDELVVTMTGDNYNGVVKRYYKA